MISSLCLSMISGQTLRICREGKPVSTFPDHALGRDLLRKSRAPLTVFTRALPPRAQQGWWQMRSAAASSSGHSQASARQRDDGNARYRNQRLPLTILNTVCRAARAPKILSETARPWLDLISGVVGAQKPRPQWPRCSQGRTALIPNALTNLVDAQGIEPWTSPV
jgi:hypothetical protein